MYKLLLHISFSNVIKQLLNALNDALAKIDNPEAVMKYIYPENFSKFQGKSRKKEVWIANEITI